MNAKTVIGVDPGPVTGMVSLKWTGGRLEAVRFAQISPDSVLTLLRHWIDVAQAPYLAVEKYVIGNRTLRAGSLQANETTRRIVGVLEEIYVREMGPHFKLRPAAEVKTWATDKRLEAAGILDWLQGMRHARDAARHALFTSVRDAGMSDPLSKDFPR